MKRIVLAGLALLASALAAQADPAPGDPFAAMYGNTLTETGPDGAPVVTYIDENGTWTQHMPDGSVQRGTYRWQDDHTVCFAQTEPAPAKYQAASCDEVHTVHKVGESWTQKDSQGRVYTIAITAGRR